ncbi:MAG: hypothetical protein LUE92_06235 [Clostridiales bacterium]|nr:hypothetical protein [Clostridiales bacterium]
MADKDLFLDTLREVAEIARVSGETVEKDEISRYFAGMDLTEEQEEMVYQYLKNVPGPETREDEENPADSDTEAEDSDANGSVSLKVKTASTDAGNAEHGNITSGNAEPGGSEPDGDLNERETMERDPSLDYLSESAFYRMYLKEVREKGTCSDEEMQALYVRLLAGEDVTGQIVDGWLMRVIRMAELYKESPVNMQDLIQEGNVALWVALGSITANLNPTDVERYLQDSVREAFEAYISESAGFSEQTKAMLAKAALLHEAQEFLASENGRTPFLRELSEYTHIPVDEIQNILALYEQAEK